MSGCATRSDYLSPIRHRPFSDIPVLWPYARLCAHPVHTLCTNELNFKVRIYMFWNDDFLPSWSVKMRVCDQAMAEKRSACMNHSPQMLGLRLQILSNMVGVESRSNNISFVLVYSTIL